MNLETVRKHPLAHAAGPVLVGALITASGAIPSGGPRLLLAAATGLLTCYLLSSLRNRAEQSRAEAQAARVIIDEITAEHWTFLAASSRALASSLNYRATLSKIAQFTTPDLGDACAVDVFEDNGSLTRVQYVASASLGEAAPEVLFQHRLDERSPILEAIRDSSPRSGVFAADQMPGIPVPESARRSPSQPCAVMILPLRSRSLVLGAITLVSARPGFAYTGSLGRLAEQVAAHAARAIDNAKLYEKAQKEIQARERILAVISHDLKNPLMVVDAATHLLLKMSKARAEAASREVALIESIRNSSQRMSNLIRDLLDAAKIRAGSYHLDRREHSVRQFLSEAAEFARPLALQKSVEIVSDLPTPDFQLRVDTDALFRVFSNIIGNAIKFTPESGRIEIRARKGTSEATISIQDSGSGIRAEDLDHVFQDFWQAKETASQGTGLGLAIARGIVEAHGGRIWVESRGIGHGSTFHFTLPLG